jgi:hypothetical protein
VALTVIAGALLLPDIELRIRLPAALMGLSLLVPYVLATLHLAPASHGMSLWARRYARYQNYVRGTGWWRQYTKARQPPGFGG